jgi:hypothetical protein
MRRRLWRLILAVPQTLQQILAWSHWRRWHQWIAKCYHDKCRGAVAEVLVA